MGYFRRKSLVLGGAALVVSALLAGTPASAGGMQARPVVNYQVPSQSLGSALNAFAEQAHVQILFDPALVRGKKSRLLSGRYEILKALSYLLRDSGLVARTVDDNTIAITNAPRVSDPDSREPHARAHSSNGPEIVVVTATRQATNLQTTPIAVTALSSESLAEARVEDIRQLSGLAPSLIITGQAGQEFPIALRGISSGVQGVGGESPVAIYLDGVYLGRQLADLFDLPDIKRIEISRGPQGTLFGRNNTAGSINIITRRPSLSGPSGRLQVDYGRFNEMELKGYYTAPISNDLAVKVGGTFHRSDGFQTWAQTGQHVNGDRFGTVDAGLLYKPNQDLTIDLRADYTKAVLGLAIRQIKPGTGKYGIDVCPIGCDLLYAEDKSEFDQNLENYGFGLTGEYNMGWARLRSITGWRSSTVDNMTNTDATEIPIQGIHYHSLAHQFSQELNLLVSTDRFKGVAGLYYFTEDSYTPYEVEYFPGPTLVSRIIAAKAHVNDESYAAFVDGTVNLTDRLSLSAGVRVTRESKAFKRRDAIPFAGTFTPSYIQMPAAYPKVAFDQHRTWDSVSPRGSISYKFSPDIFGYVTVSKGDKSGGYSFSAAGTSDASFNPEKLVSYEAGLKNRLFDHQLTLNLAGFYYQYSGLQVAVATSANIRTIFNAASARVHGIEAEFNFVPRAIPGLSISGNASYLHARYRKFDMPVANKAVCVGGTFNAATYICDLSGNTLPRAPEFSANVMILYNIELPGDSILAPELRIAQQGRMFYTEQNDPYAGKGATTELDAQLSYMPANSRFKFTAWVKNLTDVRYIANARQSNSPPSTVPGSPFSHPTVGSIGVPNAPRTFGVEISAAF